MEKKSSIYDLTEGLFEVVNPRAFISEDNLEKLSSEDFNTLRNQANGLEDIGPINFYKAAFLHGRNKFRKEAENLMIWKGIEEYKGLHKEAGSKADLAKRVATGAALFAVPAAGAAAGTYGAGRLVQHSAKKEYAKSNKAYRRRLQILDEMDKSSSLRDLPGRAGAAVNKYIYKHPFKSRALGAAGGLTGIAGGAAAVTKTPKGKERQTHLKGLARENRQSQLLDELKSKRHGILSKREKELMESERHQAMMESASRFAKNVSDAGGRKYDVNVRHSSN